MTASNSGTYSETTAINRLVIKISMVDPPLPLITYGRSDPKSAQELLYEVNKK